MDDFAYFSHRDIAKDIGTIEQEEEFRNPDSTFHKSYRYGQVQSKLNLRRPVIKMAGYGSPQAELLADKYITEQSLSETDD